MGVGVSRRGQAEGPGAEPAAESDREARELLARLFAGLGLTAGPHLDGLIERFVGAASASRQHDASDIGSRALAAAEAELQAWFRLALGDAIEEDVALLVGRAAFRACGAPERWPGALFASEPPEAFLEAVRAAAPAPLPPEQPAPMVVQPFASWSLRDLEIRSGVRGLAPRPPAAA